MFQPFTFSVSVTQISSSATHSKKMIKASELLIISTLMLLWSTSTADDTPVHIKSEQGKSLMQAIFVRFLFNIFSEWREALSKSDLCHEFLQDANNYTILKFGKPMTRDELNGFIVEWIAMDNQNVVNKVVKQYERKFKSPHFRFTQIGWLNFNLTFNCYRQNVISAKNCANNWFINWPINIVQYNCKIESFMTIQPAANRI